MHVNDPLPSSRDNVVHEGKEISAIICTHNRADLLSGAVDSLLRQTLDKSRYEIIVVDNASTDQTRQLCERYAGRDNFRYLYEKTAGLSIARNLGLTGARGKYVAFLDDDAFASPEWLERIVHTFESTVPQPASLGGKILLTWEIPKPEWFPDDQKSFLGHLDYGERPHALEYPRILFGSNMAFLRDALLHVGGFRTDLGREENTLLADEEADIFRRFNEEYLPVFYHPHITVYHLVLKERLTKKWLYRRHYWMGRAHVRMWSGQSRGEILKAAGISLGKAGKKLVKLYRANKRHAAAASSVSLIASLYREVGRMQQLLIDLKKSPTVESVKGAPILQEQHTRIDMKDGWYPSGTVEISYAYEAALHGGSLKVEGTGRPGERSFAFSKMAALSPGKHYRLTGTMRIDFFSGTASFFKCQIYQNSRWLKNIVSSKYDLKRLGQWQELTAEFVSPQGGAATVIVAIEKRPGAEGVRATIYVDAVKLEIIE